MAAKGEVPWWAYDEPDDLHKRTTERVDDEGEARDPAVSPDEVIERLKADPPRVKQMANKAHEILKKAEETENEVEAQRLFRDAVLAFEKTLQIIDSIDDKEWDNTSSKYWMTMELAYCLLAVGDDRSLVTASEIYEEIQRKFSDDAVACYRYAQILKRKNNNEKSMAQVKRTLEILDSGRDKRIGSNHWIHAAARRALGYSLWSASQEFPGTKEGIQLRDKYLDEAISVTRDALKMANVNKQQVRCVNNLIHYAWEEREILPPRRKHAISKKELSRILKDFPGISGEESYAQHILYDTRTRGLICLGDHEQARSAALRTMELLQIRVEERRSTTGPAQETVQGLLSPRNLSKHLTQEETEVYIFAMSVASGAI